MSDNIFASVVTDPFHKNEEWVLLVSDNENAPIGMDIPSFAARRRVRVATVFFNIERRKSYVKPKGSMLNWAHEREGPPRELPAERVHHWFLSDPS